ncbi:MAG: staygreen family protein [Lysinibacillus sp.]
MTKFNPERLTVDYRDGVSPLAPVTSRSYTLTHSDLTGELFLTIGKQFPWDKVNTEIRDEVLGIWRMERNGLLFNVYVFTAIEGHDINAAIRRTEIFQRELPLALTAIRYGDKYLFDFHPFLDDAFIIVHYLSIYPHLFKRENWGTFSSFST